MHPTYQIFFDHILAVYFFLLEKPRFEVGGYQRPNVVVAEPSCKSNFDLVIGRMEAIFELDLATEQPPSLDNATVTAAVGLDRP